MCQVRIVFFFKQKTAYEMRISDWISDVCSSDLLPDDFAGRRWLTSPLQRAVATADALGIAAMVEPAVTEMHWGDYEGHTPAELQARSEERRVGEECVSTCRYGWTR